MTLRFLFVFYSKLLMNLSHSNIVVSVILSSILGYSGYCLIPKLMLFNAIRGTLEVSWNGKGRGNVKHSVGVYSWRVDFLFLREIWIIP